MIAVFGPTGRVGGKVAAMLLESGVPVKALVRSPEKAAPLKNEGAELVVGNLLKADDIAETLDGCDGAFLMTPLDPRLDDFVDQEITIGRNYGKALKDSDIGHVVYMSVLGARQNTGILHFESKAVIEDSIAASGVDCTFLRPAFFMENLLAQASFIRDYNSVSLPLPPDKEMPMVSTEDVAYAAVQSLIRGGRGREEFDILGPKAYRMTEVAEIIGRAVGRKITYVERSLEDAYKSFKEMGMSDKAANDYVTMYRVYREWDFPGERERVYNEFNFGPTALETVMMSIAPAFTDQSRIT